ncbi:glycosyltransferase family 2 protein [Celeribacter litoreus]|uniref:glycosyltransferase family 2 protein n=1 Tax=Celeribacter litoreus TaxID=2876714 RepID=UPI001CCEE909|nr:glycosyltransferase family 2 protein [Celeribacter litoreus]MCA0042646.1 glycosyltransferase family 2 protein [Celeribacter litoreus]
MTSRGHDWAIAAMVDEPATLVAAFARHHLALGAKEVHLYLDRPNPEIADLIGQREGVFLTVLDETFWLTHNKGYRPHRHTGRQKFIATHTYNTTSCRWMLHCDADEFVRDADTLLQNLADTPEGQPLSLRNSERVYLPYSPGTSLFEGGFRAPMAFAPEDLAHLYGPSARFLHFGLTGHRIGKTMAPTGLPYEFGVHMMRAEDGSVPEMAKSRQRLLLHFDGMTPLHYAVKLLRKAYENYPGPKRRLGAEREAQYQFVRDHAGQPDAIFEMIKSVQSITDEQAGVLSTIGKLDETPFTPLDCTDLDLSRDGFDAALHARESELFAKAGFQM